MSMLDENGRPINIMFLSPYTSAVRESRYKAMQASMPKCDGGAIGIGHLLIREIPGFPDGLVVYSDGTVSHMPMPEETK